VDVLGRDEQRVGAAAVPTDLCIQRVENLPAGERRRRRRQWHVVGDQVGREAILVGDREHEQQVVGDPRVALVRPDQRQRNEHTGLGEPAAVGEDGLLDRCRSGSFGPDIWMTARRNGFMSWTKRVGILRL
jgi:hypothetical protein